jgi:hypothetical protein
VVGGRGRGIATVDGGGGGAGPDAGGAGWQLGCRRHASW